MARQVWKFELTLEVEQPIQTLSVPSDGKIKHVDKQGHNICLWIEIDESAPLEDRKFIIIGTGWPIPINAEHVGTVQMGSYVWHVYEQGEKKIEPLGKHETVLG